MNRHSIPSISLGGQQGVEMSTLLINYCPFHHHNGMQNCFKCLRIESTIRLFQYFLFQQNDNHAHSVIYENSIYVYRHNYVPVTMFIIIL